MPEAPAKTKVADMPELMLPRVSPLADVAVQGRFGADKGAPGVTFSVRHPLSIVTVIARKGQAKPVAEALRPYASRWAGPGQYFVVAEGRGETALYRELKLALEGIASVSDQSHGRAVHDARDCGQTIVDHRCSADSWRSRVSWRANRAGSAGTPPSAISAWS